jgi:mRNA interferase HigB
VSSPRSQCAAAYWINARFCCCWTIFGFASRLTCCRRSASLRVQSAASRTGARRRNLAMTPCCGETSRGRYWLIGGNASTCTDRAISMLKASGKSLHEKSKRIACARQWMARDAHLHGRRPSRSSGPSLSGRVCVRGIALSSLRLCNDYRLVAVAQYQAGVLMIRFFGSHEDYDRINAEKI